MDVEKNRSNLTTLLKKLATNPNDVSGGMSRILRLADRLDGEPWGAQLFVAAFRAQELRDELVRRSQEPDLSGTPRLALLRDRLASGMNAKDAVLQIAVELRDGERG